MEGLQQLRGLTDDELIEAVARFAAAERKALALLIATLAEFDARKLYLPLGYSSLFAYCTDALHLSEQATYNRIEAARLSRRLPMALECIADGTLSLTAARLLAPHLTSDNQQDVLGQARHKKTREVERLVARLRPLPPAPTVIRKLPAAASPLVETTSAAVAAPMTGVPDTAARPLLDQPMVSAKPLASRPRILPLSATTYKLQVTIGEEAHTLLREAQRLMRHSLPNGDAAAIVERALHVLVAQLRRTRFSETPKPRPAGTPVANGRHIPASVQREVALRDEHRCAFVAANGRRCEETGFLEYHHVVPYARGGKATVSNIQLRCRAHNAYEGELEFGPGRR